MDFLQKIIEKLDEWYLQIEAYYIANPNSVWILMAVIFIVLGIGNILGFKWAVDPANTRQRGWYNALGHNLFGKIVGILFLAAGIFFIVVYKLSTNP